MKLIRKLIAGLVAVGVILMSLVLSLSIALTDTYLNPEFYQSEIYTETVHPAAIDAMVSLSNSAFDQKGEPPLSEIIPNFRQWLIESIPPSLIQITLSKTKTAFETLSEEADKVQLPWGDLIEALNFKELDESSLVLKRSGATAPLFNLLEIALAAPQTFTNALIIIQLLAMSLIGLLIWKPIQKVLKWFGITWLVIGTGLSLWINLIGLRLSQLFENIDANTIQQLLIPITSKMLRHAILFYTLGAISLAIAIGLHYFLKKHVDEQ